MCSMFYFLQECSKEQDSRRFNKSNDTFLLSKIVLLDFEFCKHATCCCDGNVPEQNCRLQVGCLLVNQIKGEICFFSHKQMLDIASNATVALNMINVSEHYIQSA